MDVIEPLKRLVLIQSHNKGAQVELVAQIKPDGDLVLEGWDRGENIERMTDDWDYEYTLHVPSAYKDTALLMLLQERFANDGEFMKWLEEKKIPYQFDSW